MKQEEKNNEVDINERAITLEVDSEVVSKVRTGEITHILMDINENNQSLILENIDGNLILVDVSPTTFHGCYLYNNGEFPYAIKGALDFLVLNYGEDYCLTRIIDVDTKPGTRFNYQGAGKPIVEDPNGDSCVWEVAFEVVPVPKKPKKYLMRWNPSISSFTEKDFKESVEDMIHGSMFRMNWSIHEWEEARRGDIFYMMRVGDDKAGIVLNGLFVSDPYPSDDWAGSTKRRMYVDLVCMNAIAPDEKPIVSLEMLQTAIPEFNWTKGHSGVLLPDNVADKIAGLLEKDAPLLN